MTTLVEFLTARLDAAEREWLENRVVFGFWDDKTPTSPLSLKFMLADIAAKRRVIDYIAGVQRDAGDPPNFDPRDAQALTRILRILAEPFSGHPDYQQEWAL